MKKLVLIWILGMVTLVPATIYHMIFVAESLSFLAFGFVFFWVFGYWSVFVPMFKLYRVRKLYKKVSTREDFLEFVKNGESKEVVVTSLSNDSGIPEFILERIYDKFIQHVDKSNFTLAPETGK